MRWLKKFLEDPPEEPPKFESFKVRVNYGRNIEDGVKAGCYEKFYDTLITNARFPIYRQGIEEVEIYLVSCNAMYSTKTGCLERWGYRPATLHELLALGETIPRNRRSTMIVALGSNTITPNQRVTLYPCIELGYQAKPERKLWMCSGPSSSNMKAFCAGVRK